MVVGSERLPTLKVRALPRMADFARWVIACEPGLGWRRGKFLRAYEENRAATMGESLDTSMLAGAVCRFAVVDAMTGPWVGSATELLDELRKFARPESLLKSPEWPQNPRALSSKLRRIAPALLSRGVEVVFSRGGGDGKRFISVRNSTKGGSADSESTSEAASGDEFRPPDRSKKR